MGEESDKDRFEERRGSQLRTRTVFVCETGVANQHGQRKQVERTTTLSLPPDNSFDDRHVCWERPKFARESDAFKYAWIPQARLGAFREGLNTTMQRTYFLKR